MTYTTSKFPWKYFFAITLCIFSILLLLNISIGIRPNIVPSNSNRIVHRTRRRYHVKHKKPTTYDIHKPLLKNVFGVTHYQKKNGLNLRIRPILGKYVHL